MSLAPGTKVMHKRADSATIGTVVTVMRDGDGDPVDAYMIRWPSGWTSTEPGESLTVVESAAESALREIGRMLDLPPDAEPAAIVEALRSCVAAPSTGPFGVTLAKEGRVIGRSTREAPPAPAEETVWGEP